MRILIIKLLLIFEGLLLSYSLQAQEFEPDSVLLIGNQILIYDSTITLVNSAEVGNFFIGTGFLTGNISKHFTNNYFLGMNIDFPLNDFILQIDDIVGVVKTTKTMYFPEQAIWEENKLAFTGRIGVNLGYNLIDKVGYKIVPISGIGFSFMSSKLISGEDYKNEFRNEPFFPYLKFGLFYESKSIQIGKNIWINNEVGKYQHLRFSLGYTSPIGKIRYKDMYNGSQIYISVGIAVLKRKFYKK